MKRAMIVGVVLVLAMGVVEAKKKKPAEEAPPVPVEAVAENPPPIPFECAGRYRKHQWDVSVPEMKPEEKGRSFTLDLGGKSYGPYCMQHLLEWVDQNIPRVVVKVAPAVEKEEANAPVSDDD